MQNAIYYPHTRPLDADILRTAMLLWDEVEFIVPWPGYRPNISDPLIEQIVEVIGRESVPDEDAKKLAHSRIEDFATQQLPGEFRYSNNNESWDHHFMFARKLLPETWDMLRELNLVGPTDGRASSLSDKTGLALMSILTDCCAGERKARITDRADAYASLSRFIAGPSSDIEDQSQQQYVVPVTARLVDTRNIPLQRLIDLRTREARSGGDDLRRLRQRYRARIEKHVELITSTSTASDKRELQREFELEMRDDLADLKSELGLARREALISKDSILLGIATVAAGAAATAGLHLPLEQVGLVGSLPVIGGIVNAHSKYSQAKRSIIARHPMAYMLEATKARKSSYPDS